MAKKLASNHVKLIEKNDDGNSRTGEPAACYWNFKTLAFEWWEPAPDGFCSSPGQDPKAQSRGTKLRHRRSTRDAGHWDIVPYSSKKQEIWQ